MPISSLPPLTLWKDVWIHSNNPRFQHTLTTLVMMRRPQTEKQDAAGLQCLMNLVAIFQGLVGSELQHLETYVKDNESGICWCQRLLISCHWPPANHCNNMATTNSGWIGLFVFEDPCAWCWCGTSSHPDRPDDFPPACWKQRVTYGMERRFILLNILKHNHSKPILEGQIFDGVVEDDAFESEDLEGSAISCAGSHCPYHCQHQCQNLNRQIQYKQW
jgi:hypothetical protein